MMQQFPGNFSQQDCQNAPQRTPFPLPPMSYVMKYSNAAVSNGTAPTPPPIPTQSSVIVTFGEPCLKDEHIIRSLESQGQHRLYPQLFDHKKELKKLNVSTIANFLDLLQIISQEPSSPKRVEKLDHISTIFINMHHLLNEYRPHQARDTLREILKSQIDSAKKTNEKAKEYNEKSNDLLNKLKKELNDYFSTQKPVSVILKECELSDVVVEQSENEPKKSSKRKMESSIFPDNSMNIKVKKEAAISSSYSKKNIIISENARNTELWQQLFEDLE